MKLLTVLSLFFALFLTSCATKIVPATYPVSSGTSLKKVEAAITKAAIDRGWVKKAVNANTMELILNLREHQVVIDVKYDTNNYEMIYKSSQNMNYNPEHQTIHKKYSMWLGNLKRSIDKYMVE